MSPNNDQIIQLWDQGISPNDIASSLGWDLPLVLVILNQHGKIAPGGGSGSGSEDDEDKEVQQIYKNSRRKAAEVLNHIMEFGENESSRVKAAIYVNEEATDRNAQKARGVGFSSSTVINVEQLAIFMDRANEAVNRALAGKGQKELPMSGAIAV